MTMTKTTELDFFDLHQRISAGELQPPPALTTRGRAYRRWLKEHLSLIHILIGGASGLVGAFL